MSRSRVFSGVLVLAAVGAIAVPPLLGLGGAAVAVGIVIGIPLLVVGVALALSGRLRQLAFVAYDRVSTARLLVLAVLLGVIDVKPRRAIVRGLRTRTASALAERYGDTRATYLALAELSRRHAGEPGPAADGGVLTPSELRAFSQNGEDGVIAELVRRVGAPGRWFVEFGIEGGGEGNCVLLADVLGWSGLFIEPDEGGFTALERKYRPNRHVTTQQAAVTPENVEELFERSGVPAEPDVLSIDVDGDDYWIWSAIERHRPRIVVVEYNSALDPQRRLVQRRAQSPGAADGSDAFGASLGALWALAAEKGYRLAHTELSGVNAFFVRQDVAHGLPPEDAVPQRPPNFDLAGGRPLSSPRKAEVLLDLDEPPEAAEAP
ncbi:MAG: hypothetical protein WD649_02105 [Thermoleophilaceae bacterium]